MIKLLLVLISLKLSLMADFSKKVIDERFYSEGSAYGDLNGDGFVDIAAGSMWWEGPEFKTKHKIRPLKNHKAMTPVADGAYNPLRYSNSFINWIRDLNGDGKNDIIIMGLPGTTLKAYINPGEYKKDTQWKEHILCEAVDNESPEMADIDGDGFEELICNHNGFTGYFKMDSQKPLSKWSFKEVSEKGKRNKYTHGIGYGDVNNDGKLDLLIKEGWFEHPAKPQEKWIFHRQNFASKGGSQMFAYDVDGDGRNDVVTSDFAHGFGLYWYRNIDNESFEKKVIMDESNKDKTGINFSQLHALKLIDMDGDGVKDIVTGKRYWAHGPKKDAEPMAPAYLYIFKLIRKDGKATFLPIRVDDDSGVGTQVNAADINKDGKIDIVVSNKKGTFLFLQKAEK